MTVPKMRDIAISPGMGCARVIDRDPARARKPGLQHGLILGRQMLKASGKQAHDLALGNRQTHPAQQTRQPLAGDLPLKMASGEKTTQLGTKPAHNARRQSRNNPFPGRRLPALAPVAHSTLSRRSWTRPSS